MSGRVQRNRVKTRSGCSRCKQRRIKCDETAPHCNQCTRRGFECPGYTRPLKWSSKHELDRDGRNARERTPMRDTLDLSHIPTPPSTSGPLDLSVPTEAYGWDLQGLWSIDTAGRNAFTTAVGDECYTDASSNSGPNFSCLDTLLDNQFQSPIVLPDIEGAPGFIACAEYVNESPIPSPLEDGDSALSRHYYMHVCRINSCVDSDNSFFRIEIGSLMASSALIYHSVLSMSAAHLAASTGRSTETAIDHRSKALSQLNLDIASFKGLADANSKSIIKPFEALLGSILLGMTSAWHNPAILGTTHLHGARLLYKRWILTNHNDSRHSTSESAHRLRSSMTGLMAYWEAIASFILNQPITATTYLDPYIARDNTLNINPNPWTGVCTPIFVYLARVGALSRQLSLLKQLSVTNTTGDLGNQIKAGLLCSAENTERCLLDYQAPPEELINGTADKSTSIVHLQRLAQIYRLAALTELYRNFPGLLEVESEDADNSPSTKQGLILPHKVLALATSCLSLIAAVPRTSGVNCLLVIPLVIAGSTLQNIPPGSNSSTGGLSNWDILSADMHSIASQEDVQLQWRDFVRSRLQHILRYVGIPTISRGIEIVEKVWAISDVQTAVSPGSEHFVQWTEVMMDEKLEAVLG